MNLGKKAAELIHVNIEKSGKIKNIKMPKEIFKTIDSLTILNNIESTEKSLKYYLQFQEKNGCFNIEKISKINPLLFLNSVSKIIEKKANLKSYIKPIKKSIEYLEKNFDEEYLLLYRKEKDNTKKFTAEDNFLFMSFCDTLTEIFNTFDYNKYADKIFMLRSRIELGVQRYIFQKNNEVIIKCFNPQKQEYRLCNEFEYIEFSNIYACDTSAFRKSVNKSKKKLPNIINVNEITIILLGLKNTDKKVFNREIKTYEKYFSQFPEKIIKLDKEKIEFEIEKSLFKDFKEDIKYIKKEKVTLINLNNIGSANNILQVLK